MLMNFVIIFLALFYKYLSEKMLLYANNLLREDGITYKEIDEYSLTGKEYSKLFVMNLSHR